MSSRRTGSVSRAAETASKTRLHMDRNPQHSRMTDPSNPAGRRKELDNVMKRARQASPGSWDRKLLEVEEKDPNRWRHTGYKQMYLEPSGSESPRRSRSPVRSRSPPPLGRRSRSPVSRRARSPRKSRSPRRSPRRSPIRRAVSPPRRRSPRARSPVGRARSPPPRNRSPLPRTRSPPVRARSPVRTRSPAVRARSPVVRARSPVARRSPARRATPPPRSRAMAVRPRPPSPPPRKLSSSGSSGSSCSDDSCSVCSAKNKKGPPPPPPKGVKIPPRLKSSSPNRARAAAGASGAAPPRAGGEGRAVVQPTRELLKAREGSKRTREEKVLEWQRGQLLGGAARSGPVPIPPEQIKREGERAPPPTDPRPRPHPHPHAPPQPRVSPAAIAAALTRRDSSDTTASEDHKPQRLTLSERFGKMAQWSMDRSARLENMNMRITRRDAQLHVRIDSLPAAEPGLMEVEAPGAGSYPEELLAAAPGGLPSWDDVTVRYDYYKKKGYLRGLTLGDYVKWEEWWYKYQEWLERERAYERWAEGEARPNRRDGRRRKGGGRHRRS